MMSSPEINRPENEIDELLDEELDSDTEDPNIFRVRDPLPSPSANLLSTQALHNLIHEGVIDLNPPYQRDVVWPEAKQIGLIDSIFRNFYIPPVVFAVSRDDDGEEVRICVDGKQRLTSIQKFFDGQIPHRDHKSKKSFWYTISETSRSVRAEIPDQWKKVFAEKQITCVEYTDIAPGTEREIFQRVQLGMTLTAAEKLQAISSPWADWISSLEQRHVSVENGLSHVLEWDTKRGRDFQNLAYLVYCCDGLPEELTPTTQKMEKWLVRLDKPGDQFKTDIEEVLREFWMIATNSRLNRGLKKIGTRVAPVEFIFIGVLLYVLRKESIEDRATAIHTLRTSIRTQYADVRNNSGVVKSIWSFIGSLRVNPTSPLLFRDGPENRSKRKRKATENEDEEDEYRPQPLKNIGKAPKTRSRHSRMA